MSYACRLSDIKPNPQYLVSSHRSECHLVMGYVRKSSVQCPQVNELPKSESLAKIEPQNGHDVRSNLFQRKFTQNPGGALK